MVKCFIGGIQNASYMNWVMNFLHQLAIFYRFQNDTSVSTEYNQRSDQYTGICQMIGCKIKGYIPMLVLKYYGGGSLFSRNKIPLVEAKNIFIQLVSAMKFLKKHSVIHCNIKAENIIFDEFGRVVIIDFKKAITLSQGVKFFTSTLSFGTPSHMAPEILIPGLNQQKHTYRKKYKYSFASDIFALGCVFAEVLTNRKSQNRCVMTALKHPVEIVDGEIPEFLAQIIRKCFKYSPHDRPTIEEIGDTLEKNFENFFI